MQCKVSRNHSSQNSSHHDSGRCMLLDILDMLDLLDDW